MAVVLLLLLLLLLLLFVMNCAQHNQARISNTNQLRLSTL
jgi:outer membrane lipoprotein-sorting protein